MRRAIICGLYLVLGGGLAACGSATVSEHSGTAAIQARRPAPTGPPTLTVGDDIAERMRQLNTEPYAPPSAPTRRGSIRPRTAEDPEIVRTENGFRIRFPSHAPVATPTMHNDVLLVSGGFRSHDLFAYNAGTSQLAWSIIVDDDGPSTAACERGVCVFNTESCTIYGVQSDTGELLWSWWLGDPLMSAPSIANGLVFTAYPASPSEGPRPPGASHAFAAFDLRTGEMRWSRWIDSDVISAPMAVEGNVYAATFAGTLFRFDQQTGEIIGARAARATSAPAYIDGALYFARRIDSGGSTARESIARSSRKKQVREMGSQDARYLDYDFQDRTVHGELSADNDAANGFAQAPAAANIQFARAHIGRNTVSGLQEFQGSWVLGVGPNNYSAMGDSLVSFDRWTGDERWRVALSGDLQRLGGALGAPPAAAARSVVVATSVGELLVVNMADGAVEARYDVGSPLRTQPIVHDGWIYAGTADGQLVAIDTDRRELTGWSTWAGNAARTGVAGINLADVERRARARRAERRLHRISQPRSCTRARAGARRVAGWHGAGCENARGRFPAAR